MLRHQAADIILRTYTGLRVPSNALRVSSDGVTGVYCVSGAKAVFKPVEVLYTGEDYAVVRTTADAEAEKLRLRPGDEVIVAARDLYDGKVITSS